MLLATFEPGKEMAIANFSLAIFCLFTVTLPLLLITRGDKTEANRNFIAATVNPWSQTKQNTELAKVDLSEITSTLKKEPILKLDLEQNIKSEPDSKEVISIEIKGGDVIDETSTKMSSTDDELLAA